MLLGATVYKPVNFSAVERMVNAIKRGQKHTYQRSMEKGMKCGVSHGSEKKMSLWN